MARHRVAVTPVPGTNQCAEIARMAFGQGVSWPRRVQHSVYVLVSTASIGLPWPMKYEGTTSRSAKKRSPRLYSSVMCRQIGRRAQRCPLTFLQFLLRGRGKVVSSCSSDLLAVLGSIISVPSNDQRSTPVNAAKTSSADLVLSNLDRLLPDLESLYTDVHAHPELSMQETRTAGLAADRLRSAGYEVTTGVGKTGVVGLLRNGEGPTVMLRADMDALPVEEATGLPYASKITVKDRDGNAVPVGHMCGHDMHVTWLVGATKLLAEARATWRGTIMAIFQPGEETAEGAQAMIDDGLFKRFPKPDVVLGQHVMVGPSGTVAGRAGAITSAADSLQIRLFGRGAHGSMPQASIDPVIMAAATVMR